MFPMGPIIIMLGSPLIVLIIGPYPMGPPIMLGIMPIMPLLSMLPPSTDGDERPTRGTETHNTTPYTVEVHVLKTQEIRTLLFLFSIAHVLNLACKLTGVTAPATLPVSVIVSVVSIPISHHSVRSPTG